MELSSLWQLFYPIHCINCGKTASIRPLFICMNCFSSLPQTNLHQNHPNTFTNRLIDYHRIERGAALLYFNQQTLAQKLIHHLKYESKSSIGKGLGILYGNQIKHSTGWTDIDFIIPVPLDPKKIKRRGYNQSEAFGKGLSQAMQVPLTTEILYRVEANASQTQKSRLERFTNVEQAFKVRNKSSLTNKHILLVDDVITTGATLEACAALLYDIPGIRISMATIAITMV